MGGLFEWFTEKVEGFVEGVEDFFDNITGKTGRRMAEAQERANDIALTNHARQQAMAEQQLNTAQQRLGLQHKEHSAANLAREQAEQQFNRANPNKATGREKQKGKGGGNYSTMLTGPTGVGANLLTLGKTSLLGT